LSKIKNYKIQEIKNGYGDQAYWRSVVLPNVPKKYHKHPKQCIEVLQKRWRMLTVRLKRAGYGPIQRPIIFCQNCPPVGVRIDQFSRPCKLQKICPFCWGRRYTFKVWDKLLPVMFPGSNKLSVGGNVLTYFHQTNYGSLATALRMLSSGGGEITLLRNRGVEVRGAFNLSYIRPLEDNKSYYLWSGGIALTGHYKNELNGVAHCGYQPHVRKADLPDMFAKAMPYPTSTFKAEPGRLIAALDATEGKRALNFYGSLR
tara:strand:+ start:902 stop:1675 length:774 start_codon:yes stop_codon:yes gene_type:complete